MSQLCIVCGFWWWEKWSTLTRQHREVVQCKVCIDSLPIPSPKNIKKSQLGVLNLWRTWKKNSTYFLFPMKVGITKHKSEGMAISQSIIALTEVYYQPQWKIQKNSSSTFAPFSRWLLFQSGYVPFLFKKQKRKKKVFTLLLFYNKL